MHPVRRELIKRGVLRPVRFGEYITASLPTRADKRAIEARKRDQMTRADKALSILRAALNRRPA